MESCMPDYSIFYKFNSLSESAVAFCRCFYIHLQYIQHQHNLKNKNNFPSFPCCCCHPTPNCIENGGYPSRHQIDNTGTNIISKGSPCFTDIQCHTLVWNLPLLGGFAAFLLSAAAKADAHWYSVKSLSEGVPSLAELLGVLNGNLDQILFLSGFGWIQKSSGLVFLADNFESFLVMPDTEAFCEHTVFKI
jgi:hypothetical protein